MILCGEKDKANKRAAKKLAEQIPKVEMRIVMGTDHSEHLMTLGPDINDVNKDILTLLYDLTW